MAFCKAIAIYQEPIYLQFAAGREGAAGGLGGSGCLLSAQRSLAHSLSQGGDLPTLRPGAGAGEGCLGAGSRVCRAVRCCPCCSGHLSGVPSVPGSDGVCSLQSR